MELSGKVFLVAGGTGVLGRHIGATLAARGARVCITTRRPHDAEGIASAVIVGDLTTPGFARQALDDARKAMGQLDGVVNASGVVAFGTLADTSDETIETLWQLNTFAAIRLMREFVASASSPGVCVNITGVVAETPFIGLAAYAASKAGLSMATRSFAMEARRKGITVIDARPPHTETGLANRAVAGVAPRMPKGLEPSAVAERIVRAIEQEERELPASAFAREA